MTNTVPHPPLSSNTLPREEGGRCWKMAIRAEELYSHQGVETIDEEEFGGGHYFVMMREHWRDSNGHSGFRFAHLGSAITTLEDYADHTPTLDGGFFLAEIRTSLDRLEALLRVGGEGWAWPTRVQNNNEIIHLLGVLGTPRNQGMIREVEGLLDRWRAIKALDLKT